MKKGFHLENIFAVMCRMTDANYHVIDRTKENWFMQHTWSTSTHDKFVEWFSNYIHKVKAAQRELYGRSYMRKDDCDKAASMFTLNYGWSMK